ncbi:low-specificity L-threonine aldolase [Pseudothermotoga sp. U03pept]|uniref:low-specificity L-threonine aldolase n=1 Tax=Pseudothermotoga sp. U03pept TaxID=3447012 RepID=UPI003F0DC053
MRIIDIRSDTVTTPTERMRKAMYEAEVGDDVYQDDPTVNKLEELAAQMVGKQAALFVPSGTFGNQLAIFTHTLRGDEVIVPSSNHIFVHEVGAPAVISNVQLHIIDDSYGMPSIEKIEKAIRDQDIHSPRTGLICMENAHSSGKVVPLEYLKKVKSLADQHRIPVHLDGARIFNAAIALKVDAKEISATADSVMFCLSKGLAAPVGSILAGTKEFIERARKGRKLMGGGMRQVGILAAAGIVALTEMIDRLLEDHENAKLLAKLLSEIPHVKIFEDQLDINMVFFTFDLIPPEIFVKQLLNKGIKINPPFDGVYRFVTHKDISREDVYTVARAFREVVDSIK